MQYQRKGFSKMGEQAGPVSFSGHETFPFRYAWMKKGVDAAAEDSQVFTKDEAMTRLGMGKNCTGWIIVE